MGKFSDKLDPKHIALLDMAVDQIEAAPDRFYIADYASTETFECGTTLCIAGHMAVLEHPEYLRSISLGGLILRWSSLFNPAYMDAWLNLFLDYNFKGQLITDANIRERVEYWKQTGK